MSGITEKNTGNLPCGPYRQRQDLPLLINMVDDIFPYRLSCPDTKPGKRVTNICIDIFRRCRIDRDQEKQLINGIAASRPGGRYTHVLK